MYFLIKKENISEIVSLWLKNWNQRVDTGLMHVVTQVSKKRWAYLRMDLYAGEGLIGGEIRYIF